MRTGFACVSVALGAVVLRPGRTLLLRFDGDANHRSSLSCCGLALGPSVSVEPGRVGGARRRPRRGGPTMVALPGCRTPRSRPRHPPQSPPPPHGGDAAPRLRRPGRRTGPSRHLHPPPERRLHLFHQRMPPPYLEAGRRPSPCRSSRHQNRYGAWLSRSTPLKLSRQPKSRRPMIAGIAPPVCTVITWRDG